MYIYSKIKYYTHTHPITPSLTPSLTTYTEYRNNSIILHTQTHNFSSIILYQYTEQNKKRLKQHNTVRISKLIYDTHVGLKSSMDVSVWLPLLVC